MAYSVDLRKRVVAGVLEQGLSIGEVVEVFQVGSATVERYLRQFRERGELTPRTSPGRPRLLDAAQEERLKQLSWTKRTLPRLSAARARQ